jgi:hypothetical protein
LIGNEMVAEDIAEPIQKDSDNLPLERDEAVNERSVREILGARVDSSNRGYKI